MKERLFDEHREQIGSITFSDQCEAANKIWVSNTSLNGLFSIDMDTGKSDFAAEFEGEPAVAKGLHKRVKAYQNKLYFFPEVGSFIDIFDLDSGKIDKIPFPDSEKLANKTKISEVVQDGQKFWLFPQFLSQGLMQFDSAACDFTVFHEWSEPLVPHVFDAEEYIIANLIQIDRRVWIPLRNTDILVEFNLDTNNMNIHKLKIGKNRLFMIGHDGKDFWFTLSNSDAVIRANPGQKVFEEFRCGFQLERTRKNGVTWSKPACVDGKVYLLPGHSCSLGRINRKKRIVETFGSLPGDLYWYIDRRKNWLRCKDFIVKDKMLIIFPNGGNMLLFVDTVKEMITGKEIRLADNWYSEGYEFEWKQRKLREFYQKGGVIQEEPHFDKYLRWLIDEAGLKPADHLSGQKKSCGQIIYENCMAALEDKV